MDCEKKVDIDSFEKLGMIGQGGYGSVFMVQKKSTGKLYAMKVISKQKLL